MAERGVVVRVTGSALFAVVSIVADLSAVAVLVLSGSLRDWISQHPLVPTLVAAASIIAALIAINAWSRLRSRVLALESEVAKPHEADIERWNEFWSDFGRDSLLYSWLKEHFYVTYAQEAEFQELDRICRKWKLDPLGYYDAELQEAFSALRFAIDELQDVTLQYYWYEEAPEVELGKRRLSIPPEWDDARKNKAIHEIERSWDIVMAKYEELMQVAKVRKIAGTRMSSTM